MKLSSNELLRSWLNLEVEEVEVEEVEAQEDLLLMELHNSLLHRALMELLNKLLLHSQPEAPEDTLVDKEVVVVEAPEDILEDKEVKEVEAPVDILEDKEVAAPEDSEEVDLQEDIPKEDNPPLPRAATELHKEEAKEVKLEETSNSDKSWQLNSSLASAKKDKVNLQDLPEAVVVDTPEVEVVVNRDPLPHMEVHLPHPQLEEDMHKSSTIYNRI
jgi:hypothetical protein